MKHQDQYLLGEKETFDDSTSLLEHYDNQDNKEIQSEIDFVLRFAEEEINHLYALHHLYATEGEFFPIIELGEIREMEEKCTTS